MEINLTVPEVFVRRRMVALGLIGLALAALAVWRYGSLRDEALADWQVRISTLADAKRLTVEAWLAERRSAASIVAEYADTTRSPIGRQWSAIQELSGYDGLWIVAPNGTVVSRADVRRDPPPRLREAAAATATDGRPRTEGPLREAADRLVLGFSAPIVRPAAADPARSPRTLGAVLVTADPTLVLFPQVAHQPVATTTGQCYLVGRDGDRITLLSSRRYPAAAPLSLSWQAAQAPTLERLAVDGVRDFGLFTDTTGIAAIAAVRRISATGWGLVCRVDRWEAFGRFRERARNEALVALSAILAVALLAQWSARRRNGAPQEGRSDWLFRSLVQGSLAGLYIIRDGRFVFVNPAFARAFGYSVDEVLALQDPMSLVADEDRELVAERLAQRIAGELQGVRYSFRGRRADGATIEVEVQGIRTDLDGRPAIIGTLLEITERRVLEQQLRQSQKMDAVGQLAGGMAHDFNNLLTTILTTVELLKSDIPAESPASAELETIEESGKRGAELTRKLLAFSRRQRLEFQSVGLGALVRDFAKVMRRVVREDIDLRIRTEDPEVVVRADVGAIEQILLNLVGNARDAMPEGGVLRIEVGVRQLDEEDCALLGWGEPDRYAFIEVSDTGAGMDEATRLRAFEPFFTTKPVGAGTGLGLAMAYGLVKQHKGWVMLDSRLGKGTTVTVLLPLHGEGAVAQPPKPAAEPMHGGKETILVVEDEASLLRVATRVLERHGYAVLAASDGAQALEVVRRRRGDIDLILSDVVMPGMGGRQLYDTLRAEGHRIRVLFASGYENRDIQGDGGIEPTVPFIGKPWSIGDLLKRIRDLLDAPPPS